MPTLTFFQANLKWDKLTGSKIEILGRSSSSEIDERGKKQVLRYSPRGPIYLTLKIMKIRSSVFEELAPN